MDITRKKLEFLFKYFYDKKWSVYSPFGTGGYKEMSSIFADQ